MSLYDTSIRRPVATAMTFLAILVVGIVSFRYLPVDLLPEIEYPRVTVYTNYPNVGPEEIEKIITDPVANAVSGVPNVEQMTSSSDEGGSRVNLEFAQGTDLNAAANDVRAALDRIRDDLPVEAEPPGIWKFDPNSQEIVSIAVESSRDLESLTRLMERDLGRRFEQVPGVGTLNIRGGIYREVQVNIERDRLRAYDMSAAEVQQAIAQSGAPRRPNGLPGVGRRVRQLLRSGRGTEHVSAVRTRCLRGAHKLSPTAVSCGRRNREADPRRRAERGPPQSPHWPFQHSQDFRCRLQSPCSSVLFSLRSGLGSAGGCGTHLERNRSSQRARKRPRLGLLRIVRMMSARRPGR